MISLTQKTRRLGLSMVVAALFATAPAAQAAVNATAPSAGGAAASTPVQATAAKASPDGPAQPGGIASVRFIRAAAAAVPTPAVLLFATPALLGFVGVARRKNTAGLAG